MKHWGTAFWKRRKWYLQRYQCFYHTMQCVENLCKRSILIFCIKIKKNICTYWGCQFCKKKSCEFAGALFNKECTFKKTSIHFCAIYRWWDSFFVHFTVMHANLGCNFFYKLYKSCNCNTYLCTYLLSATM